MRTTRRSASSRGREREALREGKTGGLGVEVLNRQRGRLIDRQAAARLARHVLDRIGRGEAGLTIIFIRDRAMRKLNHDYRGFDKPTDVLSFAYHESPEGFEDESEAGHLGDVVISVETAERYADELGLTVEREIEHLIIHGTLHLAGYDHETDNGEMNRLERKLRKAVLR